MEYNKSITSVDRTKTKTPPATEVSRMAELSPKIKQIVCGT